MLENIDTSLIVFGGLVIVALIVGYFLIDYRREKKLKDILVFDPDLPERASEARHALASVDAPEDPSWIGHKVISCYQGSFKEPIELTLDNLVGLYGAEYLEITGVVSEEDIEEYEQTKFEAP